jgi:hypothetical protein
MKYRKTLRIFLRMLSIISYCLIFLMGQMIGLPFIIFLLITAAGIDDEPTRITSIIGLLGLILFFIPKKDNNRYTLYIELLILMMLVTPIIYRFIVIPINAFNYAAFIIPTFTFVILYILSIVLSVKKMRPANH